MACYLLILTLCFSAASTHRISSYDHFLEVFRRGHSSDGTDREARRTLFEARIAEIRRLNARPGRTWTAVVNTFTDHSEDELQRLLGYKGSARERTPSRSSFLEMPTKGSVFAQTVNWLDHLNASAPNFVRDQGACGSCWAAAAAAALEMHAEIADPTLKPRRFSVDELVDCTPNEKHCGGTGGCKGATSELAFQYVHDNGLAVEEDYKVSLLRKCNSRSIPRLVSSTGFSQLPTNELEPLLDTLANEGPAVVSVDASKWSMYGHGIFGDCPKDAVVNHAVLAVGYGEDVNGKYWHIRNSWTHHWGEQGHIRLVRHESKDDWCGTDYKPEQGVVCEGGPSQVPVCGMCGVLYDVSYPTGVKVIGTPELHTAQAKPH